MSTGYCEQQHQRHFQSVARTCCVLAIAAQSVERGMRLSRSTAAAGALPAALLLCLGGALWAWVRHCTLSWGQQEVLQHARQRVSQLERQLQVCIQGSVAAGCCIMHGHSPVTGSHQTWRRGGTKEQSGT